MLAIQGWNRVSLTGLGACLTQVLELMACHILIRSDSKAEGVKLLMEITAGTRSVHRLTFLICISCFPVSAWKWNLTRLGPGV